MGPKSVGYRLTKEALVFGGSTVTATDIAVGFLKVDVGDRRKVTLSPTVLEEANEMIQCMVEEAIDRMKVRDDFRGLKVLNLHKVEQLVWLVMQVFTRKKDIVG